MRSGRSRLVIGSAGAFAACEPETGCIVVWGKKFILFIFGVLLLYAGSKNSGEVCAEGEVGGDLLSSWKKIKLYIK